MAEKEEAKLSVATSLFYLLTIFGISLSIVLAVVFMFPTMKDSDFQHIKLPRNVDEAKALGGVLSSYTDEYYYTVLFTVMVFYVFLQSFAIPGSISLSVLSGYLFPFPTALLLVCTCSALGASLCYLLSFLIGKPFIDRFFRERVTNWKQKIDNHRENLLYYIVFLRITPLLPNWFINISSPVLDIPLLPFFVGTFIGVAPPSIAAIQAGTTLYELVSLNQGFSLKSMGLVAVTALLSLIPVIYKQKLKQKFD